MQILYELRYPSRWYTKLLMALLAVVFFATLATTAIAVFLVYRIVKPQPTSSEITMASVRGRPEIVSFIVRWRVPRAGWFLPALSNAATRLLCNESESSGSMMWTVL